MKGDAVVKMNSSELISTILSLLFLVVGFLTIVGWFNAVDIYHQHFFEPGMSVIVYNFKRIVFTFFLFWIVYSVGAGILYLTRLTNYLNELTLIERIVLGFGTGVGFLHVLMLVLGTLNLYYFSTALIVCLIPLCLSAYHFKNIIYQTRHALINPFKQGFNGFLPAITLISIVLALSWLLVVRGLYPGGGGDYYNHYFYYYLEVLRNHGLQLNDVWYHYYYTKGSGVDFLAMLLMDPQMPELVTFCYFTTAVLALTAFSIRLAPNSLWPAFLAVLYILFNMVSMSGYGGEFQKLHEKTSSLVIMASWAICMYNVYPNLRRPLLLMLASVMVAASIITQSTGMCFIAFFSLVICFSFFKRQFQKMGDFILIAFITGCAVLGIFTLNYAVTGLATDQALDLTWRFANLEKLDKWGVIPNILMVEWTRNNYALLTEPYGWSTLLQLSSFLRLERLWILLSSAAGALVSYWLIKKYFLKTNDQPLAVRVLISLSFLITVFIILSTFAGHVQSVSYLRFSSFFFPLLVFFSVACWACFISICKKPFRFIFSVITPIVLLGYIISIWPNWFNDLREIDHFAFRFLRGKYSLADAYMHQHGGTWFGAINPAAVEAMRQVTPGARIWSVNGNAHCSSVSGCKIESVMSFKLSSHLSEILNGTPEESKRILQSEGLNYFLYTTDFVVLDLLVHSQLFKPETLNKYFSIKWTNGTTYLLTWRDPKLTQITPDFIKTYKTKINTPIDNWFSFDAVLPVMDAFMKDLYSSPHPWKNRKFPPLPGVENKKA